jgi:soluble lytic murein transglycosylase
VEPALAAALVKQESNFTADAVSPAGARGLMQVMPEVGRSLWSSRDAAARGAWSAERLFDPEVNLALGMRHLRAALRTWPHPAYALAAYNAGGSRVRRWRAAAGGDDPELFVERIPFEETRDYVRIVLRGRDLYRVLYGELR